MRSYTVQVLVNGVEAADQFAARDAVADLLTEALADSGVSLDFVVSDAEQEVTA